MKAALEQQRWHRIGQRTGSDHVSIIILLLPYDGGEIKPALQWSALCKHDLINNVILKIYLHAPCTVSVKQTNPITIRYSRRSGEVFRRPAFEISLEARLGTIELNDRMLKPCFAACTALRRTRNTAKGYAWRRNLCRAQAANSWEFAAGAQREQPRHRRVQRDHRGRDSREGRGYRGGRDYGESRAPSTNPETEVIRAAQATSDDLLYGVNPVLQALLSKKRAHFTKLFIQSPSTERTQHRRITKEASDAGIPIAQLSKHGMNTLCENRPHQGVILAAAAADVPVVTDLRGCSGVWVALDQVTDAHNVGAIMRSAVFLGASGVVVCTRNCCGVTAAVAKASAGAVEVCDVRAVGSMPRFLRGVREQGWRVLGLGVGGRDVRHVADETVADGRVVLVLGSEGRGLRKLVGEGCDEIVGIGGGGADAGEVDSLNVSVAAGVALFELLRARGGGDGIDSY